MMAHFTGETRLSRYSHCLDAAHAGPAREGGPFCRKGRWALHCGSGPAVCSVPAAHRDDPGEGTSGANWASGAQGVLAALPESLRRPRRWDCSEWRGALYSEQENRLRTQQRGRSGTGERLSFVTSRLCVSGLDAKEVGPASVRKRHSCRADV